VHDLKDILKDIVQHTHSLGFLPLVKITTNQNITTIESIADDRSVILSAITHQPVSDFFGTFGMPNLDKLNLHLKNPEYKENATIQVTTAVRDGETIPVGLHFKNATQDFENYYRFMNHEIINEKIKSVKFKGAAWNVDFEPSLSSIHRLKLQAEVHNDETVFQTKTENGNLLVLFGDGSSHAGNFVFEAGVKGTLKNISYWPVNQVRSILNLSGNITMQIADVGAMQITVDSGIATYSYILPAQTK